MGRKGKYQSLVIGLDALGFFLIFLGAGLLRFSKEEVISIIGGLITAVGVTILGLTRVIPK